mmetsp:Transcript_96466/g.268061  ORF Transcript_96466/g.268061 Transcript_96466/m.268061 type:complete len:228 (-) Transcript_96466:165-848(-)
MAASPAGRSAAQSAQEATARKTRPVGAARGHARRAAAVWLAPALQTALRWHCVAWSSACTRDLSSFARSSGPSMANQPLLSCAPCQTRSTDLPETLSREHGTDCDAMPARHARPNLLSQGDGIHKPSQRRAPNGVACTWNRPRHAMLPMIGGAKCAWQIVPPARNGAVQIAIAHPWHRRARCAAVAVPLRRYGPKQPTPHPAPPFVQHDPEASRRHTRCASRNPALA